MIPYGRQDISQADIDAVVEVLRSDWLTQGPAVPRFEMAVADYSGAQQAVATCNATAALHIACLALGIGPGDRVWTSAITFVASANCARYCGADVDFVDIDPQTCNMSVERLAEKLADAKYHGMLPKAIIPVHLCGQSCEMAPIHTLAQQYGFRIIEDASHAIGGHYRGEPVGNCRYSDITVFSFHPVKIITTGEGGMALTNNATLAQRMQRLRSHGITTKRTDMQARSTEEIWNYQQIELGYNYRMTDIQAALGSSQLERLTEFVACRQAAAERYDTAFAHLPIKGLWQHPNTRSSYHLYPVRISPHQSGKTQRQVYEALHQEGIRANLNYIPVYRHPYYESQGFRAGYCPEAENYFREAISLPIYPTLTAQQQDHVIRVVTKALGL